MNKTGNEFQSELFEELVRPEKKRRVQKPQPIAKRYSLVFNISHEQLVFSLIALIMVMVLIFSLGVERGKGLVGQGRVLVPEIVKQEEPPVSELETASPEAIEAEEASEPPPVEVVKKISRPYTIQIATYWSKSNAKKELENLKRRGLDPFIISGNGKYEVCVGKYINREDAKNSMGELKKNYKDCFLRKR